MAKGDYYFRFFYQRFYHSTRTWNEAQEGAYLRLLTYQFDHGFIPNDLKEIKKISPFAAKNWKFFEQKFNQNLDGTLFNSVMKELREKNEYIKSKNLENSKLGVKARTERLKKDEPNGLEKNNRSVTGRVAIPLTNNQYNTLKGISEDLPLSPIEECLEIALRDERWVRVNAASREKLSEFNKLLEKRGEYYKLPADYKKHFANRDALQTSDTLKTGLFKNNSEGGPVAHAGAGVMSARERRHAELEKEHNL